MARRGGPPLAICTDGTLVWWLADVMVVGTCPVPTPIVTPDPPG